MKRILLVVAILVGLGVIGALGWLGWQYHNEDKAFAESERIVNEADTKLTNLESQIQAATGGDVEKQATDETLKMGDAILAIQKELDVENLLYQTFHTKDRWISEQRKTAFFDHLKAVNNRCNQVLDKYHIPLGVVKR